MSDWLVNHDLPKTQFGLNLFQIGNDADAARTLTMLDNLRKEQGAVDQLEGEEGTKLKLEIPSNFRDFTDAMTHEEIAAAAAQKGSAHGLWLKACAGSINKRLDELQT